MEAPRTLPALHSLNNGHGVASWLLTKNHDRMLERRRQTAVQYSRDFRPLAATQV